MRYQTVCKEDGGIVVIQIPEPGDAPIEQFVPVEEVEEVDETTEEEEVGISVIIDDGGIANIDKEEEKKEDVEDDLEEIVKPKNNRGAHFKKKK